jgi:hypothetical protein
MAKQKVVFDLFMVFGATIVVYLVFGSSSYVHIIALVVLIIGVVYVLQYNAYRIRLFGNDDTSVFIGGNSIQEIENKWWKAPKSLKDTGSSWWNSVSSLKAPTSASFDISKWTSTTTAQ